MVQSALDVAILGGGLAGHLLARQLHRRLPGLRIGVFERRAGDAAFKVGESTVEIAARYLVRQQGLTRYLYDRHLPKNGIRYFFDGPNHDFSLTEMSELGTVNLPFHPAFQIDRARMETDLLEMNRAAGILVREGVRVLDVETGAGGEPHRVVIEERGRRECVATRWVVDATGRTGLLAHALRLRTDEPEHRIGSVWGRFEGLEDIDDVGDDAFRGRVRYTARGLSTLHFLYPGYWIWVIPLRGGLTSVGVTGTPVRDRRLRSPDGFRRFLEAHSAIRELMAQAKAVDHGSLARIAFGTRRFFHPDRWALIGEAATAADPLYSPGSDFIALENDFLTDLIEREERGESEDDLSQRLELYDRFMSFRHEATMRLYRGLYGTIGSYELMRVKWDFDIASYHNLWVAPYMTGQLRDTDFLRVQLRQQRVVLHAMENFAGLFRKVEHDLHARGSYFRCNRGRFSHGLENIDFLEQIGRPRTRRQTLEQAARTFNIVRRAAWALLGRPDDGEPWPLHAFVTRPLA